MYYLYCIALILTGVGLGYFGLKHFSLSLAGSLVLPMLLFFAMIGWLGVTTLTVVVTVGILAFILAKPFSYIIAYNYLFILIAILVVIIFKEYLNSPEANTMKILLRIIIIFAPAVVVYLLRKHIKIIVIGYASGFSVGLGLAGIITAQTFQQGIAFANLDLIMASFILPFTIVLLFVALGIVFQYKFILTKFPELQPGYSDAK